MHFFEPTVQTQSDLSSTMYNSSLRTGLLFQGLSCATFLLKLQIQLLFFNHFRGQIYKKRRQLYTVIHKKVDSCSR